MASAPSRRDAPGRAARLELQGRLSELHAAGIELVAIRYDEPETLRAFARQRGIGYPLLSDAGSRTIDAYALRNEKARGRTAGIPHPGTILVDRAGVVRARLFHEGYQRRHGPDDILAAAARLD